MLDVDELRLEGFGIGRMLGRSSGAEDFSKYIAPAQVIVRIREL